MSAPSPNAAAPEARAPRRFPRLRRWLRWSGLSVGLLLLGLLAFALILNRIGLPGPVKSRVLSQLRAQGWDVEFSRLRWSWSRGIIAEDLRIQRTNEVSSPQLYAYRARCQLDHDALGDFDIKVTALDLSGGRFAWPLLLTNEPAQTLILNDVNGQLRFEKADTWNLRALHANLLGVQIELNGTVTNASALRPLRKVKGARQSPAEILLHKIMTTAGKCQFSQPPDLLFVFHGDARKPATFSADFRLTAAGVKSPWLSGTNLVLLAHLTPPPATNAPFQAELLLNAGRIGLPWGEAREPELRLSLQPSIEHPVPADAHLRISLRAAQTRWGDSGRILAEGTIHPSWTEPVPTNAEIQFDITAPRSAKADAQSAQFHIRIRRNETNRFLAETTVVGITRDLAGAWGHVTNAHLRLRLEHSVTNPLPAAMSLELTATEMGSGWGNLAGARIEGSGTLPGARQFSLFKTNLTWPDRLANLPVDLALNVTNVQAPKLQLDSASVTSQWRAPFLEMGLSSRLYQGFLAGTAHLNAETRVVTFKAKSEFDAQQIAPLLNTNGQRWLSHYSWQAPPRIEGAGSARLPAWTNQHPDWRREVLPGLAATGRFEVGAGAYRGVSFSAARSPFIFSNMLWQLPAVVVEGPEGKLEGSYVSDRRVRDFHWTFTSRLDPMAIKPLLDKESQRRALEDFEFTTPPEVEARIDGSWADKARLAVEARVTATNFSFRGVRVDRATSGMAYTNRIFAFIEPIVQRDGRQASAPGVTVDWNVRKVHITNAFGNVDPHAVAQMIGSKSMKALAPYRFDSPPTVRVNGTVDVQKKRKEHDLHFEVSGGPFHWKQFNLQQVSGDLAWMGQVLQLTNLHGEFYGGRALGDATFDFAPTNGADFSFQTQVAEANLRALIADISNKTNKLEGILSGQLTVTRAQTENPNSWNGHGQLRLRDGLIWDIPVFGVFSPVLNALVPGLGNSRAREATATFGMTNGVIYSRDLEIRATAMRMQYRGKVDFDGHVEGRMEAELLRDMPGLGFVISKIFWPVTKLFEYRVDGTINKPKPEPLYILPRIILLPFHPLKSLKEMLPEEEEPVPPLAPPKAKQD